MKKAKLKLPDAQRMNWTICTKQEQVNFISYSHYIKITLIVFLDWVVKHVEEQKSQRDVPNWQLYGTAMFFLRDMLNCETKNGYFICKNIPFIGVYICGTVVNLSTSSDKYIIAGKIKNTN